MFYSSLHSKYLEHFLIQSRLSCLVENTFFLQGINNSSDNLEISFDMRFYHNLHSVQ